MVLFVGGWRLVGGFVFCVVLRVLGGGVVAKNNIFLSCLPKSLPATFMFTSSSSLSYCSY